MLLSVQGHAPEIWPKFKPIPDRCISARAHLATSSWIWTFALAFFVLEHPKTRKLFVFPLRVHPDRFFLIHKTETWSVWLLLSCPTRFLWRRHTENWANVRMVQLVPQLSVSDNCSAPQFSNPCAKKNLEIEFVYIDQPINTTRPLTDFQPKLKPFCTPVTRMHWIAVN